MKQGEPGRNTTVEPGPFDGRAGPLVHVVSYLIVEPGRNTHVVSYLIVEPGRNTTVEPGPFDGRAGPLVAYRISKYPK
jgi:hypothetical protein